MGGTEESGPKAKENGESSEMPHSRALMKALNGLRESDKLVDITLIVGDLKLKAHRVVLAACSDYFAAMFTDPMKESQQSEVTLVDVNPSGMNILVEYAYTSVLDLDRDNIHDILSAATHVQMSAVVVACSKYLEAQIDLENCVDIATLADLYTLDHLKNKTYRFICAGLEEFSKTAEMYNLSCIQLQHILSCDYPVDCTEAQVVKIVAEYCVKKKVSLVDAQRLFSKIRFSQIEYIDLHIWPRFDELEASVHASYYNVMRTVGSEQRQLRKKQYGYANVYDALTAKLLTNTRGMAMALVKIGGFHKNGLHNEISYALPDEKKWFTLTVIPHIEQCNYGIAVLGNVLFVVGGSYDVCLKEYIHGFGFRYSAAQNKWSTISPIQSDRCRFSLTAVGNFLYAVGGVSELFDNPSDEGWPFTDRSSNCERYNAATDSWEFIEPLQENRSQHAGAAIGNYLYISGGIDRHLVLSSFWRYDTIRNKWKMKKDMLKPRADHVLLSIDKKIYACGGWYENLQTDMRVLIGDIDVYDERSDNWHFLTTNPVPTFHAGITVVESKIYFVGGLLSDETINCSSTVQIYDLVTGEWSTETKWQSAKPTWECTCAAFYVPRCREGI